MDNDWERIARETAQAMEQVAQAAMHLAQQEVTWRSEDRRITVHATAGGTITGLDLAPAMPQRYDSAGLAKRLAEALRAAQLKARREFDEAFEQSIPEQVAETNRLIRESVRE
ncbi:MAG TPA: YbaB/EbfC family nucleoid-associated protein [Candidatus Limnocylindrales bacterium]|nr:YbaB/EbfC family nucleoid-associated protein [Candidatus Limnocylindrales bacterium]